MERWQHGYSESRNHDDLHSLILGKFLTIFEGGSRVHNIRQFTLA